MRVTKGLHERNHFARRHFIFLHAAALSNVVTLPGILSPAALAAETITDRDFDVMVPDGFVRLPRTGRATSNFLLVTGNRIYINARHILLQKLTDRMQFDI